MLAGYVSPLSEASCAKRVQSNWVLGTANLSAQQKLQEGVMETIRLGSCDGDIGGPIVGPIMVVIPPLLFKMGTR